MDSTRPGDRWSVDLPYLPMSLNQQLRAHWTTRKRERQRIETDLHLLLTAVRCPRLDPDNGRRRFVTVQIVKGPRGKEEDAANLHGRAKHVLDALKNAGYLVDDNPTWLEWGGVTEHRKPTGYGHTTVTIEETGGSHDK